MKFKRILTPLLIILLLLSIVVMGAPTYVNVGPTTYFEGDVGIPEGCNYYIGEEIFEGGGVLTFLELTDTPAAYDNGKYAKSTADGVVWDTPTGGYTNLTSFVDQTAWRLFYSNTDGDVVEFALGTDGQYLKSTGATSAPIFDTPGGAGDMLKATYDTDADSDIDVAAGGTEKSIWTLYAIPYLSGTTAFGEIPIGTDNYALTVNGATGYDWTEFQLPLTFGIADTNKVQINSATVADDDYAKFTAIGLEGRNYSEVKTDLDLIKCRNNATAAPTVNDDSDDGYAVNSIWSDVTADKSYVCVDATVGSAVWIEITSAGGAPADATYITQTANGTLSAEQALGALATGILKSTTTTGVVSIAVAGTDYQVPLSEDDIEAYIFDADAETILGDWDNTANPWADNEVSDTLTSSSCTGLAATATALATARTIGGVSFDGTANIVPTSLSIATALGSDHTYLGITDSKNVGENVVFGQLLYFDWTDTEWKLAKANAVGTTPAMRIALETKGNGEACVMLVQGYIRDDSAYEFTAAIGYLSITTGGAVQYAAPSVAGNQVQRIGIGISADIMYFDPSIDVGEI